MWALVESNSVSKIYTKPTAVTIGFVAATYYTENVLYVEGDELPNGKSIGDIKYAIGDLKTPRLGTNYPSNIMSMWTASELEAIGIYEVVIDNTNLKNSEYYTNGAESFNFASNTVTKSYASATAKTLTDTGSGDSLVIGLKSIHTDNINGQANSRLQTYDWYTLREASGGTTTPSAVTTYQAAVRTAANSMTTKIDNAADVDALAALYVYNSDDPPVRPLGEWPDTP